MVFGDEFFGCTQRDEFAVVDYADSVAEFLRFFHVMGGEDDGFALVFCSFMKSQTAWRDCGSIATVGSSKKAICGS